jgi:hypothetical protein
MRWPRNIGAEAAKRREERLGSKGAELERKYPIALAMFVVLAVVAWFTVGEGNVIVLGRPVQVRLIPILILGLFAFRTYVAMQADRIRREKD